MLKDLTIFYLGTIQYFRVGDARRFCANPNDVMPLLAQCFYSIQREILVGKKAHPLYRDSINFFSLERSTGVAQTGLNILKANTRIVAKDFISTPALGEEIDDELNTKASASNNGFTD